MITVHCLAYSRAIRLIWLMEDLGQPYNLVRYDRTDKFRAPQSLRDIHPLGKSPVIEDGDLRLAESASCLRYLTRKFEDQSHYPDPGSPRYVQHEEMLDYVESSFAAASMSVMLPAMKGKEIAEKARDGLKTHLNYITLTLPDRGLLFGETASLADIQMSYLLANLAAGGFLADAPRVETYWNDLQQQEGYIAATQVAGAMAPDL